MALREEDYNKEYEFQNGEGFRTNFTSPDVVDTRWLPGQIAPAPVSEPTREPTVSGTGGAPATRQIWSPELEGLKHSVLTRDWFGQTPGQTQLQTLAQTLMVPESTRPGLSDQERQRILNQAKANVGATTQSAIRQLQETMGTAGFRPGESGFLGGKVADIHRAGISTVGDVATGLAIDESRRRAQEELQSRQLNLQRLLASGQFAGMGEELGLARAGRGMEALGLGAGLEQFGMQWPYQQEMDALSMLMNLYGGAQQSQQAMYNMWGNLLQGGQAF